jgi:FtsH-binding integral membrane protein
MWDWPGISRLAVHAGDNSRAGFLALSSAIHSQRNPADASGARRNLKGPMTTLNLTLALRIAGVMHLGLMCAGAMMPGVVGMRSHLAPLPPFIRRLFWVYYLFIGLCLVSFGTITVVLAPTLAAGGDLARALCIFLAVFWTLRLVAATFIFDLRPYLTNKYRRIGYHATNIVFIYLPVIYAWTAWKGGR